MSISSRIRKALLAGLIVSVAALAVMLAEQRYRSPSQASAGGDRRPASQAAEVALPVLWDAPSFSYVDQGGRAVTKQDLLGHVWVADFIFTQCTAACPMITAKLILLQRQIADPSVRFVSFSVDPANDTPAVLKAYAESWHGDESRWRLLCTGDDQALQATVTGMKVPFARTGDPTDPIIHTNRLFLVDAEGKIRGIYNSSEENSIKQLAADVRSLAGGSAAMPPALVSAVAEKDSAEAGHALFVNYGCQACHANSRIAPLLGGVSGSKVTLEGGGSVAADEAYLRESILDPKAKTVAGYTQTMPSYRPHLTDAELAALVAYLKTLPAPSPASTPDGTQAATPDGKPAELVVDPVCGMKTRVERDSPFATYAGHTYYFCCAPCRERFVKDPEKFVKSAKTAPDAGP